MKAKKRILVAPLDWGIGHATRCIPIIKALINNNYEVIIAADGRPMHLLSIEFPSLEMIRFPGYNVKYSKYLPMIINMGLQIPKIFWGIKKENKMLSQIIQDYSIDGIISDNRFGLYSEKVPCVFITHQLKIQSPYFSKYIQKVNYKYIDKFNECWIMDDEKQNLAGELSAADVLPRNSRYIGCHSRFNITSEEKKYDFLAIVSGPEPQRTIFERGLLKALKERKEKSLIVLGKPELKNEEQIGNLTIKSHLKASNLNKAILQSELIICRPGYSTIMDLCRLNKAAFLIPTPGQTEQEYLAKYLTEKKIFYYQDQNNFDFEKALNETIKYTGFKKNKPAPKDWGSLFNIF